MHFVVVWCLGTLVQFELLYSMYNVGPYKTYNCTNVGGIATPKH